MIKSHSSKSSITADTAFQKDLTLQGCTNVPTRTYTQAVKPTRLPVSYCSHSAIMVGEVSDTTVDISRIRYRRATPTKLPVTKSAKLHRRTQKFARRAMKGQRPYSGMPT